MYTNILKLKQTLFWRSKHNLIILLIFNYALLNKISTAVEITHFYNDSIVVDWNESLEYLTGYNLTMAFSKGIKNESAIKIKEGERNIILNETEAPPLKIEYLYPGMTYQIEFDIKPKNETAHQIKTNFTTKPNAPTNVMCYHDDKNLCVEWRMKKPENETIFEKYLVHIFEENMNGSFKLIKKGTKPRMIHSIEFPYMTRHNSYKAVIQTRSQTKLSERLEVECLRAPDPPSEVLINNKTSYSFEINWNPPKSNCSFDSYKVYITKGWVRLFETIVWKRENISLSLNIKDDIKPGHKYDIDVNTVYKSVESLKSTAISVTTPPLPILSLMATHGEDTDIYLDWTVDQNSTQDSYTVIYRPIDVSNNSTKIEVNTSNCHLSGLMPGHNYSIIVTALSNGVPSQTSLLPIYQMTNPLKQKILEENRNEFYNISKNLFLFIMVLLIILFATLIVAYSIRKFNSKVEHINMNLFETKGLILNEITKNQNDQAPIISEIDGSIKINRIDIVIQNEIGHGQFGTVYSGILSTMNGRVKTRVAIKRLRFVPDQDYLREVVIMKNFDNDHVLELIGVSEDADRSSLIVLPFMERGDLRSYLLNEKNEPTVRQMLQFGIDVAKGMEYLSWKNLVHRDLAARNCMLDNNLCVKVADFGLTRNIYQNNYYKTDPNKFVELPIRWMPIESIEKGIYNTKTDAWSYGVLMWEVITRGVTPYPQLHTRHLIPYLKSGQRLEKPEYCPQIIYNMMCKCWSIESTNRPTFAQLAQSLEAIISDPHNSLKVNKNYYNNAVLYCNIQS